MIITLRNEIESIINNMTDCYYIRTKPDELNKKLNKIKVGTQCICAHIDQTTITKEMSNYQYAYYSIPTRS